MSLRRPLIALSLVAAAVITIVVLQNVPHPTPDGGATPSSPSTPRASASVAEEGLDGRISTTYVGPAYDPAVTRSPTRHKPQSKLWYHAGVWWGILVDRATGEFHIWWLNPATHQWVDTETVIDERSYARQDVYADGDDLFVASAGSNQTSAQQAVEMRRYRYSQEHGAYELLPDYPIRITETGVEAVTITRDSTGAVWAGFIADNRVQVVASDATGLQWSSPFVIPSPHSSVAADQAAIVSLDGSVGVLWSNQNENGLFFATHADGEPVAAWGATEEVLGGTAIADDHLSLRALERDDGLWLYAAAKTSLDQSPTRNQQLPQIVFLARDPSGSWSSYLVGRVADHHTRPILVLDAEHDRALVFATSPFDGGEIYLKSSSLDRISFPLGLGTPVIASGPVPKVNNATSTRQPVSSETGLVVLAADDTIGQYLHVELGLDGRPAPDPAPQQAAGEELLHATWDGALLSSSMAGQGWTITPADADAVVTDAAGRRGIRLASASGASARICRPIRDVDAGRLVVTASLYVEGAPLGDSRVLAVRGGSTEMTGARFLENGHLAYRVGTDREQTDATWVPGRWYEMQLAVDFASATYGWTVRPADAPGAAPLVDVAGVPLIGPPLADQVCVSSPTQAAGSGMLIDELEILWERP